MTLGFRKHQRTAVAVLTLVVAGCSVNPATGDRSFTALMSPEQEIQVGREQHPKIIQTFGGEYDRAAVAAYVDDIGQQLARVSDLPNLDFTFTVLDSDVVNAFALPGGYIYISRGLLALATTEAELAGVLGHEIGHVTARHSAQRYSQGVAVNLGAAVLGILGGRSVAQLAQFGAGAYIQSYSRSQEFQADQLGVRYLSRAGYDTGAMASFLAKLQAQSTLEAQITGQADPADRFNIMSTHPRTADRVAEATAAAGVTPVANARVGTADFLATIDGLDYRGSPRTGFISDRDFIHTGIGFRFQVPPGFRLSNNPQQVLAVNGSGAAIIFDSADGSTAGSMVSYIRDTWASSITWNDLEAIDINGMAAATGSAQITRNNKAMIARPLAIRFSSDQIFRFLFLTPADQSAALSEDLRRATFSFRRLSADERSTLRPLRIDIRDVGGRSSADFAAQMAVPEQPQRWFEVINGLTPGQQPTGQVKVVTN